jgi:hypothetical protein
MTAAAAPEATRRLSRQPLPDVANLVAVLAQASALIEQAQTRAVALGGLIDLDVPGTTPASADDQAHIRSIASLYLAAQLEEARLLPAVEMLAGLAISGGLHIDLGPAADLIAMFWRDRSERFHETERRAFFARLFGSDEPEPTADAPGGRSAVNSTFEDLMIDLCESLYRLDEASFGTGEAGPHAQTRVRIAGRTLTQNLLEKSGGITVFAARDILAAIQSGVRILQQTGVQRAFGVHSLWGAVRAIATRYLHADTDVQAYVARGKSGLTVLSWLADSLPSIDDGPPLVTLDHPAIAAATEWLQASLTIREAASQARG